jgi:hypothetical protein
MENSEFAGGTFWSTPEQYDLDALLQEMEEDGDAL